MKVETYLREGVPSDVDFIYNSWLKSFQPTLAKALDRTIYFREHKKIIAQLLSKAQVYVSSNPDDISQIFGYVVAEEAPEAITKIHYVYVKFPYRRYGLGTELMRLIQPMEVPYVATHWTRCFNHVADKWNLVFNPYALKEEL